jgi:hypothetical protein
LKLVPEPIVGHLVESLDGQLLVEIGRAHCGRVRCPGRARQPIGLRESNLRWGPTPRRRSDSHTFVARVKR